MSFGDWEGKIILLSICRSTIPDYVIRTVSDVFVPLDCGKEQFYGRIFWRKLSVRRKQKPLKYERLAYCRSMGTWIAYFEDDLLVRIEGGENRDDNTHWLYI